MHEEPHNLHFEHGYIFIFVVIENKLRHTHGHMDTQTHEHTGTRIHNKPQAPHHNQRVTRNKEIKKLKIFVL